MEGAEALALRLGERFLQARLRRWWLGSALGRRHRVALDSIGLLGSEASALLRLPSLQLHSGDPRRIRLSCDADIELSLGPSHLGWGRRLVSSWTLRVEPRIERGGGEGPDLAIAADFAQAELSDLRVRPSDDGRWSLDPISLDPFAEWRLAELGKLVVRHLLDRVGLRQLGLDVELASRLARRAGLEGKSLDLRVGDGWVDLGFLSSSAAGGGLEPLGGDRWRDGRSPPDGLGREASFSVWASRSVVERLLESWLETDDSAREWQELGLELAQGVAELRSCVRPVRPAWARRFGLRTRARLRVGSSDERMWPVLDSLEIEAPGWLSRGSGWLGRRLAAELESRAIPREIRHPRIVESLGGLRITGVEIADECLAVELREGTAVGSGELM
ncbi:MAG: hypothetical protein JRG86_02565 [Deltaproteobacteria bacterium]|jgi:hypothetical protein|nr:hypothetical protein [Deltaproteobacteria bacterium]